MTSLTQHGHKILACDFMAPQSDRQLQLGAYAIGTGDENWFAVSRRDARKGCEVSNATENLRALRFIDDGANPLNELLSGINVDSGVLIGEFCRGWLGRHGMSLSDRMTANYFDTLLPFPLSFRAEFE